MTNDVSASLFIHLHRGADGAQDGLVVFLVAGLAQDEQGSVRGVEATRPASVGQVEADELYLMADGGLTGEGLAADLRFELGIVVFQGQERGFDQVLGGG